VKSKVPGTIVLTNQSRVLGTTVLTNQSIPTNLTTIPLFSANQSINRLAINQSTASRLMKTPLIDCTTLQGYLLFLSKKKARARDQRAQIQMGLLHTKKIKERERKIMKHL
jgi:uncharacterized membrane protein